MVLPPPHCRQAAPYAARRAWIETDSASTKTMEQHDAGTIAEATGEELVASVSPPTALSLTWGLDDYVDLLAKATPSS